MYPLAHLAASLLVNETHRGDRASAAAGALVPDAIDKSLAWVLGVTPSGRYAAHSLAGASVLTLAALGLGGRSRGVSFGASYLCHLALDVPGGGHVPWLLPFKRYERSERRWSLGITARTVLLELIGMFVLARLAAHWRAGEKVQQN